MVSVEKIGLSKGTPEHPSELAVAIPKMSRIPMENQNTFCLGFKVRFHLVVKAKELHIPVRREEPNRIRKLFQVDIIEPVLIGKDIK